jgi:hypothetical protein
MKTPEEIDDMLNELTDLTSLGSEAATMIRDMQSHMEQLRTRLDELRGPRQEVYEFHSLTNLQQIKIVSEMGLLTDDEYRIPELGIKAFARAQERGVLTVLKSLIADAK